MTITLWKPKTLSQIGWDLENWLDGFYWIGDLSTSYGYYPFVVSFVKDNTMHLRADLPGVDPMDVDISLKDGHLCINGERKRPKAEEGSCYSFEERNYGKFSRCFHLPLNVDAEKIRAKYKDGGLNSLSLYLKK